MLKSRASFEIKIKCKKKKRLAIDLPIALDADTAKWFKAIPRGKKAQIIRDAIALYRITNEVTGEK